MEAVNTTLFLGDIHGDFYFVRSLLEENPNTRSLIQAGDFGYWEHTQVGKDFLDGMSVLADAMDCNIFFTEGNHENHDRLRDYNDGKSYGSTPVLIRHRLWWLPRGCVVELDDGRSMMSMGGAVSIDKPWRRQGIDWWPGEEITQEDIEFARNEIETNGPVDVLLTHDAPSHLSLHRILANHQPMPINRILELQSAAHRKIIADVFDFSGAKTLVHGHYHARQTTILDDGRKVIGLSQERTKGAFVRLDQV